MQRAQGTGHRVKNVHWIDFLKAVIFLLSNKSFTRMEFFPVEVMIFLRSNMYRIFTHSNRERLAIFRKLENSLTEKEPEPSAILFEILMPAERSCSANLKYFFLSASSA